MQQELEEQLRAFGDTMSDAFAHGFEGKGMDIGDRAWDVGKAAVHAANYGISEAGKAMRQARDSYYQSQRQAHANGGTAEQYAGMPQWARNFFASRPELTPVKSCGNAPRSVTARVWLCWPWASSLRCFSGWVQWAASSGWALFRRLLWATLWCRLLRAAAS